MKQNAQALLPGTMVKNKCGEVGRLITNMMNLSGQYCWLIDWPVRGITCELLCDVQLMELA